MPPNRKSELDGDHSALLVVGMHRSGTSAMARVLSFAGAALPKRLLPASAHNPRGHWEPLEIAALNDAILAAGGTDWCDPLALNLADGRGAATEFVDAARTHLRTDFGNAQLLVLKEPRMSLLLGFWRRVLLEERKKPFVVIMVRHPLEVAASLLSRNDFSQSQSALLWLAYMLAAERGSRGIPRVFVAYDDLLTDWRGALQRIDDALGLSLSDAASAEAVDLFLDHSLRHHTEQHTEAKSLWPLITEAFELFLAAARDGVPDEVRFDRLTDQFTSMLIAMSGVLKHLRAERDHYVRAASELGAQLDWERRRRRGLEAEVISLTRRERGLRQALRDIRTATSPVLKPSNLC